MKRIEQEITAREVYYDGTIEFHHVDDEYGSLNEKGYRQFALEHTGFSNSSRVTINIGSREELHQWHQAIGRMLKDTEHWENEDYGYDPLPEGKIKS